MYSMEFKRAASGHHAGDRIDVEGVTCPMLAEWENNGWIERRKKAHQDIVTLTIKGYLKY